MIPAELRAIPQWVGTRNGSKLPFWALTGEPASVSQSSTWCTYEQVEEMIQERAFDLPGFVFDDNGIVGIDIDDGYDEDGVITPMAAEIIKRFGSYTEKSRSGRGFHILVYGNLPFDGKNNRSGVEVYQKGRYFIMTGKTVRYTRIRQDQEAVNWLLDKYFPETLKIGTGGQNPRIYNPEWVKPEGGRIKLRPIYPAIPAGCRNICLTSLGGLMHNTGYSPEAIYSELCYANETACQPTLPEGEIESIVRSVTRYKR